MCVADTSPVIAFSSVERLDILHSVFGKVIVPSAAHKEMVTDGEGWAAAAQAQAELRLGTWMRRADGFQSPHLQRLRVHLGGAGEAEAIALAINLSCPVLLDELAGRRAAMALGVTVIGSLRVLRLAKAAGKISEVAPIVTQMRDAGIYYGDDLLVRFFKEIREVWTPG